MQPQASKIILAIIITAIIVGSGVYWWQTKTTNDKATSQKEAKEQPNVESIISKTSGSEFTLSIKQEPLGPSFIKLQDIYNEGAGFSLRFPSSWGFVNVTKHNLTDAGGYRTDAELPQRASYIFKSEFKPVTHYFTIIISYSRYKNDWLVTQNNRIYITEDKTYYYNYSPSTEHCIEEKTCKQNEIPEINAEITEIIDSFKLL